MSGNVTALSCSNRLRGGDLHRYSYTEIYIDRARQRLLNPAIDWQLSYIIIIISCLSESHCAETIIKLL